MTPDIDTKILKRLLDKDLIPIDLLMEKGVLDEAVVNRIMSEILNHELIEATKNLTQSTDREGAAKTARDRISGFGRYVELERLGQGGMAQIYKAYDPELNRHVALKFLSIVDPVAKGRLLREARAQARIDHPNICKVYEVGELEGRPYISMHYIAGKTLKEAASELSVTEKIVVVKEVAEALHEAHRIGLIHRDIKPTNVMIEQGENGRWIPHLVDFGLAREVTEAGMTFTNVVVGTPLYMSPEQASGRVHGLDRRSDVFSIGVMLYELLSGVLPFEESRRSTVQQVLSEEPIPIWKRNSSISSDLETIVMKCLEKEPQRRYESAKGLADDLQRYLNAEPIVAKPPRIFHRLVMKVKRNKLAASVVSLAVLVALFLLGMLLWVQWRSRIQSQYANDFGQEVRYIESMLRSVFMSPAHDIRSELGQAKKRLVLMDEKMNRAPQWASAPGHNALGQTYLALKEYEKARVHLEKAWQSGYQESSTAFALGKVMGILYQRALIDVPRGGNKDVRESKMREIEKLYRDPSIAYLKLAAGHVESPSYVEGLIDFYEKRYPEAMKKAEQAQQYASWSYEPKKLKGDVYLALGLHHAEKGNYDQAKLAYNSAGIVYRGAQNIFRSEDEVYLSDCDRWIAMMYLEENEGTKPENSMKNALETCDRAILLNPERSDGYAKKSMAYFRLGIYLIYFTGEDPKDLLKKSIECGRMAIQRDPKNISAYKNIGSAYNRLGEYELMHGQDARDSLRQAVENYEKALTINPTDNLSHNNIGNTYLFWGEYQATHGEDPRGSFQTAIQHYQKALEIGPKFYHIHNNAGIAYSNTARYEMDHGKDPASSLREARRHHKEAFSLNSKNGYGFVGEGIIHALTGERDLKYGKDPRPSLYEAIDRYKESLKLSPNLTFADINIGKAYVLMAEHDEKNGNDPKAAVQNAVLHLKKAIQTNSGDPVPYTSMGLSYHFSVLYAIGSNRDPAPSLALAGAAVEKSLQLDSNYYKTHQVKGKIELLKARWAIEQGRSPEKYLNSALNALKKSLEINRLESETLRDLAECFELMAKQSSSNNDKSIELIRSGIEFAKKSLDLDPERAETVAIQGRLLFLLAEDERDPLKKIQFIQDGKSFLQRSVRMNPLLERQYAEFLKEEISEE